MDLLEQMNSIVEYIETRLDDYIDYDVFGKMLCCSNREFSNIFTRIAGMSVSEYIRRRRLSKAALDIQGGKDKIIDIALKYGYQSQASFSRAFKEIHGQNPLWARKNGTILKNYPKISFALIIRGVNEMNYRIESKERFMLTGLKCADSYENWCESDKLLLPQLEKENLIKAPFWYVGAYFLNRNENDACIIGAELKGGSAPVGMAVENIPATTWVVFPFAFEPGANAAGEIYAQAVTEWLPASNYVRNENAPFLELYGHSTNQFEVWIPIVSKKSNDKHMVNDYFKSERLLYRPSQRGDLVQKVKHAHEPSRRKWFYFQEPDCLTEQFWLEQINKNIETWSKKVDVLNDDCSLDIVLKETGEMIGNIGLAKRYRPDVHLDGLEIGYDIFEAYQGNGFATEAVKAALEWAFSRFREINVYPKIEAHIEHENWPSRRVAEKAGFVFDRTEKYITVYSLNSSFYCTK